MAIADGTASIYLSSGGGFIGGGRHESVRQAAEALVSAARAASGAFAPVSSFPAPAPGQVRFYARVDDRVHAAEAGERTLQSGQHPLSPVYDAGQSVITAYRLIDR